MRYLPGQRRMVGLQGTVCRHRGIVSTRAAKVCVDCGAIPAAGTSRCWDCISIRSRRQAETHVPTWGNGKRLSGLTAQCSLHSSRGCPLCFPEVIEAQQREELA